MTKKVIYVCDICGKEYYNKVEGYSLVYPGKYDGTLTIHINKFTTYLKLNDWDAVGLDGDVCKECLEKAISMEKSK